MEFGVRDKITIRTVHSKNLVTERTDLISLPQVRATFLAYCFRHSMSASQPSDKRVQVHSTDGQSRVEK